MSFRRPFISTFILLAACLGSVSLSPAQAPAGSATTPIQWRANERVVFLGDTFTEREIRFGYVETVFTLAAPAGTTFRNLGWSGDTVFGDARSYFGPPEEGLQRLDKNLDELKPTLVIMNYGSFMAWEDEAERAKFIAGYEKLIERVKAHSAPEVKVILATPAPLVQKAPPLPDLTEPKKVLAIVSEQIRLLARKNNLGILDWQQEAEAGWTKSDQLGLSDNGVHFNEEGWNHLSNTLARQLGLLDQLKTFYIEFRGDVAPLRQLILEKNALFFHRWRPTNETYLFGFRKHEQGKNGAEIPLFDPFIAEKDKAIAELRAKLKP